MSLEIMTNLAIDMVNTELNNQILSFVEYVEKSTKKMMFYA